MAETEQLSIRLNNIELEAINHLIFALQERYGRDIVKVILFGSKARGDSTKDSDIDLLIITSYENWTLREEVWRIAAKLELHQDVIFNIQLMSLQHWDTICDQGFSLCQHVEQDGVVIF